MRDELLFEENNFFVSKTLKQIDSNVCYKKEIQTKLVKNLQEQNKENNKEFIAKNKQIHLELMRKRSKKLEEIKRRENSKNNIRQLNIISSPYNLQFLPKISPFIQNINNFLVMDNQKAEKNGSMGFEYIWKQEKLLKLSGIKPNDINDNKKTNKSNNFKIMHNHHIHNDENDDIFDSNYNERKKKCEEYIKLKQRLNRIIKQNKKVKKKYNIHKEKSLKFKVKKIYHPRYESIEKHKPDIILSNKTKRLFPDFFIQKSLYLENNKPYSTNNKGWIKTRNLKNKRKTYYICSSYSLNNLFLHSTNENNETEKNNFIKNGINMKLSNYNTYDNNKTNIINNQSIIKNIKNFNNKYLNKSKSQVNMFEK